MRLEIKTKEFKDFLKQVGIFTELSLKKRYNVGIDIKNRTLYHQNELITLISMIDMETTDTGKLTIDASALASATFPGDTVSIEWAQNDNAITVKSGKFVSKLGIMLQHIDLPEREFVSESKLELPLKVFSTIYSYARVPYSFIKRDEKIVPIEFKEQNSRLVVQCDDGYTLIKLTAVCPITSGLCIKIPDIALKTFLSGTSDQMCSVETQGMVLKITNGRNILYIPQMSNNVNNFDNVMEDNKQWMVGCKINTKEVLKGVKTISTMMSKDDGYIQACFKKPNLLSLSMRTQANDSRYDDIEIMELGTYNDSHKFLMNMHQKSFLDFTSMISSIDTISWYGNHKVSYYSGQKDNINVEYLFPVIQV